MDKNQVTGLILISLLLFAYYYFLAPKSVPDQPAEKPVELIQDDEKIIPQVKELKDSVALAIPVEAVASSNRPSWFR